MPTMKITATPDLTVALQDSGTVSPSDHPVVEILRSAYDPFDIAFKDFERRFVIGKDGNFVVWSAEEGIVLKGSLNKEGE